MFGLERTTSENAKNQVRSNTLSNENNSTNLDPIENAKQELCEEFKKFEKNAENIANNPIPENMQQFSSELKEAHANIQDANIREYGYNPPKEMVLLHAKVEQYYNQMIRNQVNCSAKYQGAMEKLNELLSLVTGKDKLDSEDEILVKNLIQELNNTKLEMPTSHPGILSKNEKPGFQINFSSTDVIDVIKREANRFYSMCENAVHQLFIFIQKLFNDLLSIFDTAKNSLKNDACRKIVDNQIPR